jgi:hypothetical protein
VAGVSLVNLTFILAFLEEEGDIHKARASVLVVVFLTLCNWVAATLPHLFKYKNMLNSQFVSGIVGWHILCVIYGVVAMTLMALPTLQTIQCCVVSFDNTEGFTNKIDFDCPSYSCDYLNMFIIVPFLSIVWSTFCVHYQIHNIFRYLHDSQQEAVSYDRLVQRLTAAQGGGAHAAPRGFDLDGIILANETTTHL